MAGCEHRDLTPSRGALHPTAPTRSRHEPSELLPLFNENGELVPTSRRWGHKKERHRFQYRSIIRLAMPRDARPRLTRAPLPCVGYLRRMGNREPSSDLLSKKLSEWEAKLRTTHPENVARARTDPQKAGHVAESIWVEVAEEILPPTYRVLRRRYLGTEVDIIILPPSAPKFYNEATVVDIPPDVASAVIHVKNTLNKAELRDAMRRVHRANTGQRHYRATSEREREGLPSAIVALGSEWAAGFDSALAALLDILREEFPPNHPSQIPGFVGTPDWEMHNSTHHFPAFSGIPQPDPENPDPLWGKEHVVKSISSKPSGRPIHSFAQWLYTVCRASDPSLEPMRVAITQLFSMSGEGRMLRFNVSDVYSDIRLSRKDFK